MKYKVGGQIHRIGITMVQAYPRDTDVTHDRRKIRKRHTRNQTWTLLVARNNFTLDSILFCIA